MPSRGEVTELLRAWNEGDSGALNALMPLVYPVLHRLAAAQMHKERHEHTLQPTALVNEAFLRLAKAGKIDLHDRIHFMSISARLMRQVLVDHARSRGYQKRGEGAPKVPLDQVDVTAPLDLEDILTVHFAIEALAERDPRKAQVVELRFFGGLTGAETASALGISEESVNRDWRLAKAWLLQNISESGAARG